MSRKVRLITITEDMALVPLTQGYVALIDAGDVPLVDGWNWSAIRSPNANGKTRSVYAVRKGRNNRLIYLHRSVLSVPNGISVDHVSGDGLDNRKVNLRVATTAQNQHNARLRTDSSSGAKGVSWCKKSRKWKAYIKENGKQRHLGLFNTIEAASHAYGEASVEVYGAFARVK